MASLENSSNEEATTVQLKPILNTSLPPQFRQIRLELAREPDHPHGEDDVGYIVIAPLERDGHIALKSWMEHRDACRVTRFRPDGREEVGHLVHRRDGAWAFHYDQATGLPDETGYHFANERFVPGEYVSINENGAMHTYRVRSAVRL
ncbi:MAG: hypothetical protein J0I08_07055 [Rhizobiales bacterium]|jgi:hypothetical protein|nr:hypothetical protein [Hyphomicrobiales bacterium]